MISNEKLFYQNMKNPYLDSWYDVMQVCENGHIITARAQSNPVDMVDKCPICGSSTITKCKECGTDIQGVKHSPSYAHMAPKEPPLHCHKCGKPYPWAIRKPSKPEDHKSPEEILKKIFERFHIVARQLRNRHDRRPTIEINDEYDVQDLLHALLKLEFDDIRPEEWTPSYAGAASKMDFLLKREEIVVETKKTRKGLGPKEVGEQLIIDIAKYKEHPHCRSIICFIYDPEGLIGNPKGLKDDLEKLSKDLKVIVYIYPQ